MGDIKTLKEKLKIGDQVEIARLTGSTPQYVNQLLSGKISHSGKKAEAILEAGKQIIASRERLRKRLAKSNK